MKRRVLARGIIVKTIAISREPVYTLVVVMRVGVEAPSFPLAKSYRIKLQVPETPISN